MPWPQQSPAVTCSLSAVHRWEKTAEKKTQTKKLFQILWGLLGGLHVVRAFCQLQEARFQRSKQLLHLTDEPERAGIMIYYNIIIFIWKKQLKARPCWNQFFKTRHFLLLSVWWGSTACIQLITWEAFWCTESVKTLRLSFNSSRLSKGTAPTFPGAGASSAGTVEEFGATSINSIWARSSGILALRCTTVCWKTITTIIQKTSKKTLSQLGFFILLPCLFFAMWFLHPFLHLAFLHSYNVWRLYEKFWDWLVIFIFPVSSSMVDLQQSCKGKQSKNN